MKEFKLVSIGHMTEAGGQLRLQIKEPAIPAMKNLSYFSHGLLVSGDGSKALHIGPVELSEVNETEGYLVLGQSSGLQPGNPVYDIKPYMPCEDRILTGRTAVAAERDQSIAEHGPEEMILKEAGMIRKEKGRYYLYPDDFKQMAAVAEKSSHIRVIWWFSRFDKPEYRRATQGEPPYENAPRSGIFASRSPVRPNPIALTVAEVIRVDEAGCRIEVAGLDCFDRTPLIGIRPYLPAVDRVNTFTVPPWLEHWPEHKEIESGSYDEQVVLDDSGENLLAQYLKPVTAEAGAEFWETADTELPADRNQITISGARQNNLKNLSLVLPKGKVIAVAGVSGSGKSSLAFDTIYAESRQQMSETADSMEKPDVDSITGLPPAIAVAQRVIGRNPRSSVGTLTGIQDRLRLLYAAIGCRHCPQCGRPAIARSRDELVNLLTELAGYRPEVVPYGSTRNLTAADTGAELDWGDLVDRALELGQGAFYLHIADSEAILLQNRQMCYHCEYILFEMSPAVFSYNNPESMCPVCSGLGNTTEVDPELIVEHPERSLLDGASAYWGDLRSFVRNPTANWMRGELLALAERNGVDLERPWNNLPADFRKTALFGSNRTEVSWSYVHPGNGRSGTITRPVEGAVPVLNRLMQKGGSTAQRIAARYVRTQPCPACGGERLGREGRMVTVAGLRYPQTAAMTIGELLTWVSELPVLLNAYEREISESLLKDIRRKALQLKEMGLLYLSLDRAVTTLSGGELQRLKLAAQMGIGLSGLLYVMDEPTAGLHPRDYHGVLAAMRGLKDEGNTVLVVEHEEMILAGADWFVEIGPAAGRDGGEVIWQGIPSGLMTADTQTARFLSGREQIMLKRPQLPPEEDWIIINGARGNNLKDISVRFPKGRMTCVTGVSGSGKSTLTGTVIAPAIEQLVRGEDVSRQLCDHVSGTGGIRGVIYASQNAIGRSSRSNIMTYIGILDEVRKVFAATGSAKTRGLPASTFSFNSKDGQCDACKGEGIQVVAVPFAADIRSVCPVCAGRRYKQKVLEVTFQDKNIFEVMELSIEEALEFFKDQSKIAATLQVLCEVGLGYLRLGQGTPSLSGGEAQRLKLAKVLTEKQTGSILYILDEPTSGLHFSDIRNLLQLLSRLAGEGHTILIIEHNRHVIRNADWIIDLGPEGGTRGGRLLVQGPPQVIAACKESATGAALSGLID